MSCSFLAKDYVPSETYDFVKIYNYAMPPPKFFPTFDINVHLFYTFTFLGYFTPLPDYELKTATSF